MSDEEYSTFKAKAEILRTAQISWSARSENLMKVANMKWQEQLISKGERLILRV
jgi:hypothetical protein